MKKLLLLGLVTLFLAGSTESFAQRRNRGYRIRSDQVTRNDERLIRERERQIRNERRGYRADVLTRDHRGRKDHRRGNGYYRRGAGSPSHPVFGVSNRYRNRYRNRNRNN